MIRVGSFFAFGPSFGRSDKARNKKKLAYVRLRSNRVRKWVSGLEVGPTVEVQSDLPTATLRGSGMESLAGNTGAWLRERGAWIRPRAIPLMFAFAALVGALGSVDYLTTMGGQHVAEAPTLRPMVRAEVGPPGDEGVRDDVRPTFRAIRIGD